MKKKLLLCGWLIAVILTTLIPVCSVQAALGWYDIKPVMSNEEFFGKWESGRWSDQYPGKLNYDYSLELKKVENCVKNGDYVGAQVEILDYYKNKKWILDPTPNISVPNSFLAMNNVFSGQEYVNMLSLKKSAGWQYTSVDITNFAVRKSQLDLVLLPLQKDSGDVIIKSMEADAGAYKARIDLVVDEEFMTLYVTKDGYVKASNKGASFTEEDVLLTRESGLPIDDKSKRAYLNFDLSILPKEGTVKQAVLTVYTKASEDCRLEDKDVLIFMENDVSWEQGPNSTLNWDNYVIQNFSWQGCDADEMDWATDINGERLANGLTNYTTYGEYFYGPLHRMGFIHQLAGAYVKTKDETYADTAVRLMLNWIYNNGNKQIWPAGKSSSGGEQPGNPGGAVGGYPRALDTGIRTENFVNSMVYLVKSSSMKPEYFTEILKSLWNAGNFLRAKGAVNGIDTTVWGYSAYHPTSNWGTGEKRSEHIVAIYYPEFREAPEWKQDAIDCYLNAVTKGNSSLPPLLATDGSYIEATTTYTNFVLGDIRSFRQFYPDFTTLGGEYDKKIKAMTRYAIDLILPNGDDNMWGDSDQMKYKTASSGITLNQAFLGDPEVLYFLTNGEEGTHPTQYDYIPNGPVPSGYPVEDKSIPRTSTYYPNKKLGVMRNGFLKDDFYLFVENDGNYGGHEHPDDLSIIVAAYGKALLTDQGRGPYIESNAARQFVYTTTKAHNTVTINGSAQQKGGMNTKFKDQNEIKYFTTNDRFDFFEGNTTTYVDNEGVLHTRSIAFIRPGYYIVTDKLEPKDKNKPNTYDQTWHSSVDFKLPDENDKSSETTFSDGKNMQIVPVEADNITASLKHGYFVPRVIYNVQYLSYEQQNVAGDTYFNTVLYPNSATDRTKVRTEKLALYDPSWGSAFKIIFDREKNAIQDYYYVSYRDATGAFPRVDFGNRYQFDGKVTHIQTDSQYRTTVASIVDGTALSEDGIDLIKSDVRINNLSVEWGSCAIEISTSMDITKLKAPIKIFAPNKLLWVKINGKDIPFLQENDYIIIGE